MRVVTELRERLRALFLRGREDRQTEEELRFHLERQVEENVRRGMGPEEARRQAHIRLGGAVQVREATRDARGVGWLEDLVADLRYGLRSVLRRPGFSGAAVLTLALGIGATTALFTVVDALLFRPLPVSEPDRLVEVSAVTPLGGRGFSYAQFEALRARSRLIEAFAGMNTRRIAFGDDAYAEELRGRFVTGDYFRLLGIRPALGRLLGDGDDRRGAPTAGVVLSYGTWRSRFGGDPGIVGRSVRLNGVEAVVLGVAPRAFAGMSLAEGPAFWAPLALLERVVPGADPYDPLSFGINVVGRMRDGVSVEAARAESSGLAASINEAVEVPSPAELESIDVRVASRIPASYAGGLLRFVVLLGGATVLVLLIAGSNVAGMLLARGVGRRRELAVRAALGAGRGRLVRQLVTEGGVLFLLGGAVGIGIAYALTQLLLAFRWPMPVVVDLDPNARMLLFALTASLVVGIGFSLLPALRTTGPALAFALKGGAPGAGPGGTRLRSALVAGQVAMSLLLLVGAGLFLRALHRAFAIDPGFEPDRVWVATIDLRRHRLDNARGRALFASILERTRAVPGVESASWSVAVPLGPGGGMLRIAPSGAAESESHMIRANVVGPSYFETMGIPVLRGRAFTAADREGAPRVAIVNRTMAERLWPDENPIGKRFIETFSAFRLMIGRAQDSNPTEYEVVGVVPDGKEGSLLEEPEPHLFVPYEQSYRSRLVLALRVRGDAARVISGVRDEIHALEPALPLLSASPLTDLIADELAPQRIGALLTTLFGLLGLVLAGVGLYGVMAYAVGERTREIGVRIALGARRGSVLRLVLTRGLALGAAGTAVGVVAALGATRLLAGFLFGIQPADPATFVAVAALLGGVALLASYVPARRATRVDPVVALRAE